MRDTTAIKKGYHKAGKSFVLLFNRVSMYGPEHPFSVQAVDDFFRSIQDLLKASSPVVLIYTRKQFFIEDEPLDPSLNTFKISAHFKKTDVSSISIENGLDRNEVETFIRIFLDARRYPGAEEMRAAAAARQVQHIKINHVFYQKMTADEEVVSKSAAAKTSQLSDELDTSRETQDALSMIAGKLLIEELDQGVSLKSLLADPEALSRRMVSEGPAEGHAGGSGHGSGDGPPSVAGRLRALGEQIRSVLSGSAPVALPEIAEALVRMKRELFREIEARRAIGVFLEPADEIREQADSLTDTVVLELVRKAYEQGNTPVERLAFLLQRIVPEPEELARLLPRIRGCLMAEGMSLADFSRLIQQLGTDRQNDGVVQAVNRAAEEIGADGGELLERLKSDPAGFTRLLYLASAIEKESGSSRTLSDILVDHLERMASRLVSRQSGEEPSARADLLRRMILQLHSGMVQGLQAGGVDAQLVGEVEERLRQRLEASVEAIRSELSEYKAALKTDRPERRTLLQDLEESLAEGHALKPVLQQVSAHFREQRLDPNDFQKIYERIEAARRQQRRAEKKIDEIVFGKRQTLTLLEIELARATRYGTDLCAVSFSVYKAADRKSGGSREPAPIEATTALLRKLRDKLRNTDWIGILNQRLFLAVMPMTTVKEAHLASRRLLKSLNAEPVVVSGRPVPFKLAGSVIHFDHRQTPDVRAFIQLAESGHAEMAHRLRNLQDFM
ncbi:MAG: hypothetical protein MUD16_16510 [Desulfobacterales bacterium]|jgi:hypothetical protein|nr:hypothetical protein [Desulfobacterales bacterium]MCU0561778.1 hypothetical protein [Desulfobacterales bacterium]